MRTCYRIMCTFMRQNGWVRLGERGVLCSELYETGYRTQGRTTAPSSIIQNPIPVRLLVPDLQHLCYLLDILRIEFQV